jgi:hypothetical protein
VPVAEETGGERDVNVAMRRVAAASFVGALLEWYDFYAFATASALVFGPLFFPSDDPLLSTMASFRRLRVRLSGPPNRPLPESVGAAPKPLARLTKRHPDLCGLVGALGAVLFCLLRIAAYIPRIYSVRSLSPIFPMPSIAACPGSRSLRTS